MYWKGEQMQNGSVGQRVIGKTHIHLNCNPVSRAKTKKSPNGRNAVAAAAYRAGVKLQELQSGLTFDYTVKGIGEHGTILCFIDGPDNMPPAFRDRRTLWNACEARETHPNAQTAREFEFGLPVAFDSRRRERVAREFVGELVRRYGLAADGALHRPGKGDPRNFHAHVLTTTREVTAAGLGRKLRILDDQKSGPAEITSLRQFYSDLLNRHAEEAGIAERFVAKSYKALGYEGERLVEAMRHMGPARAEMERREPLSSDLGKNNQGVQERNATRWPEAAAAPPAQVAAAKPPPAIQRTIAPAIATPSHANAPTQAPAAERVTAPAIAAPIVARPSQTVWAPAPGFQVADDQFSRSPLPAKYYKRIPGATPAEREFNARTMKNPDGSYVFDDAAREKIGSLSNEQYENYFTLTFRRYGMLMTPYGLVADYFDRCEQVVKREKALEEWKARESEEKRQREAEQRQRDMEYAEKARQFHEARAEEAARKEREAAYEARVQAKLRQGYSHDTARRMARHEQDKADRADYIAKNPDARKALTPTKKKKSSWAARQEKYSLQQPTRKKDDWSVGGGGGGGGGMGFGIGD